MLNLDVSHISGCLTSARRTRTHRSCLLRHTITGVVTQFRVLVAGVGVEVICRCLYRCTRQSVVLAMLVDVAGLVVEREHRVKHPARLRLNVGEATLRESFAVL